MILIDGKKTATAIKEEIKEKVQSYTNQGKRPPYLIAVLVGNDPASRSYVRSKERQSEKIGFKSSVLRLDEQTTEDELLKIIKTLIMMRG